MYLGSYRLQSVDWKLKKKINLNRATYNYFWDSKFLKWLTNFFASFLAFIALCLADNAVASLRRKVVFASSNWRLTVRTVASHSLSRDSLFLSCLSACSRSSLTDDSSTSTARLDGPAWFGCTIAAVVDCKLKYDSKFRIILLCAKFRLILQTVWILVV